MDASSVPLRPLKLRFDVRRDTPLVRGAWPIPTQGPHPHSNIRAPASTNVEIMPSRNAIEKICRLPAATTRLTSGWTVWPFKMAAALARSV